MDKQSYTFASDPRAAPAARAKYREPAPETTDAGPSNIMYDSRVRRGNTYGGRIVPQVSQQTQATGTLGASAGSGAGGGTTAKLGTTRAKKTNIFDVKVAARQREEVDLTPYLTEQKAPRVEIDVSTQVDDIRPDPPRKPYVPAKTGVDASTQIEPADGLFDFDYEVEPILDVIAGKTLEQALLEVEQEDELTAIENRKTELVRGKQQEVDRIKAMEAEAIKAAEARDRHRHVMAARAKAQATARRKVAALASGRALTDMALQAAFGALEREHFFGDAVADEVEQQFMPVLYSFVQAKVTQNAAAVACTDDVLQAVIRTSAQRALTAYEERARVAAAEAKRAAEEEERRMYVRVFVKVVHGETGQEVIVGPIRVARAGTVAEVEGAVAKWLSEHPVPDLVLPDNGLNLSYGGSTLQRDKSLLDQALPDEAKLELSKAIEGETTEE